LPARIPLCETRAAKNLLANSGARVSEGDPLLVIEPEAVE